MWRAPEAERWGRRWGLPWRRPRRREIVCRMVLLLRWWMERYRKMAGHRLGRLANGRRETGKRVFQLASTTPPLVEPWASSWTRKSSILSAHIFPKVKEKGKLHIIADDVPWSTTRPPNVVPSASTHSSFRISFPYLSASLAVPTCPRGN